MTTMELKSLKLDLVEELLSLNDKGHSIVYC